MGRPPRLSIGNIVYHVLNRANAREKIFRKEKDFQAFEKILEEAKERYPIRILAYALMPNHWHFLLYPYNENDLSIFLRWLTLTHTQRWHAHYKSIGYGHLYQGRFKSFPVQKDEHFFTVTRYIERNALRAKLVERAEDWRWGSAWRRTYGSKEQKKILSPWPAPPPDGYEELLNRTLPHEEMALERIRISVQRGRPFGGNSWVQHTARKLGLDSTLQSRGRPRLQTK